MRDWLCIQCISRILVSFLASFSRYLVIFISFRLMMIFNICLFLFPVIQ